MLGGRSEDRFAKQQLCLLAAPKQALTDAGLDKEHHADAYRALDKTKAGVLIGSGMGGLTVFQDGVKNLVEKGHKKMSPFFIPYAITNMCANRLQQFFSHITQ